MEYAHYFGVFRALSWAHFSWYDFISFASLKHDITYNCEKCHNLQLASSHFKIAPELHWSYLHEIQNVTRFINACFLLGKKVFINKWSNL